ncbi:MAG: hypothetical protein ACOC0Z_07870 [Halohasta sp.]
MREKRTESCGRCSMSTVVDAVDTHRDDSGGEGSVGRDPFGDNRIEVDEHELRRVAPAAWMSRLTGRLNDLARRLTYGR